MKNLRFIGIAALVLVFSAFTIHNSVSWKISEGYSIKFSSENPSGIFSKMDGEVIFDENDLSGSSFNVKVDVSSINTGNGMKNKHAKSDKWFDAEQYPTINFTSKKFNKTPVGYEVTGTLEMHGVKKEFTMPFTFKNNVFESSFTVNRLDYNIGTTKGMSGKVPNEIKLNISVPVTK